jgi:hypothetical protein
MKAGNAAGAKGANYAAVFVIQLATGRDNEYGKTVHYSETNGV